MDKALHSTAPDRDRIARRYLRDEPAFISSLDFGPFVAQGTGSGPAVLIGDQAEINLFTGVAEGRLDYRMALLARDGDIVLVRKREPQFEAYLAEGLGLKDLRFLEVNATILHPVARLARDDAQILQSLVEVARVSKGLTLTAYLTTGNVWRLAQTIGEASGQIVHVCGPSPRATRRANDKLWFTHLARQIIGSDATPPTLSAYGPGAAAGLVRRISRQADKVIVKVPDSAGSAGNLRLGLMQLEGMTLAGIRQLLLSRLHAVGWRDSYPILVGVWDANVTHSPSAQLWLPKAGEGPPTVEGIFEQRLRGGAAAFAGAARSDLPDAMQARLSAEATRIAQVLQQLGYFGRCSFDAVVCDGPDRRDIIHWIECNGRWGGVSIPMTAASRLAKVGGKVAMAVVQETVPRRPMHTDELCAALGDLMYRMGTTTDGIIILSPPENARGVSVNLLALGESQKDANALLVEAMQRLMSAS